MSRTTRTNRPPARLAPSNGASPTARRLTRAQLRELERELRRERARLERTLESAAGASTPLMARQEVLTSLPDTGDSLPMLLESRALGRYSTLVEALRRLESGTYGKCLGCSEPISFGRLEVMPETTHCIACGGRA